MTKPHRIFCIFCQIFSIALLTHARLGRADAAEWPGAQSAPSQLHQQIDELVVAELYEAHLTSATDSEFLRRVYLDLIGRSPTVEEARSFLTNEGANKRAELTDRLLASEEFNDFFAAVLDIMFMERRRGSRIPQEQWRRFLCDAVARGQPFDQIVRTIIQADGTGETRGAAKFLIQREVEPNALTRDVGRIFLGRDLQCAQCHDHPLIGGYFQAEYYGIYAFVDRSYLFENKSDNNKAYVGERAEGDTEFKSVFLPGEEASRAFPHLLGELALDVEPRFEGDGAYVVSPTGKAAGVPKFSRREQLARLLTHPANSQFSRNAANRVWAHMMGRGLVEPVDFFHGGNPPSHPELLQTLAEAFVAMDYDIRAFLRQIALSRTYQRSIDYPVPQAISLRELDEAERELAAEIEELEPPLSAVKQQRAQYASQLTDRRSKLAETDSAITAAGRQLDDLEARDKELRKARSELKERLSDKRQQLERLSAAATAAKHVADAFPDDQQLAAAHAQFATRAEQLARSVSGIDKEVTANRLRGNNVAADITAVRRDLDNLKSQRIFQADMVAEARGALRVFATRQRRQAARLNEREQRRRALAQHREYLARVHTRRELTDQVAKAEAVAAQPELEQGAADHLALVKEKVALQQSLLAARQRRASELKDALTARTAALEALDEALSEARSAAGNLDDPALSAALASLDAPRSALNQRLTKVRDEFQQASAEVQLARDELEQLVTHCEKLVAEQQALVDRRQRQQQDLIAARAALQTAIVEADQTRAELQRAWERTFVVQSPKPLTPEQLAGSTIAALGLKARFQREAKVEWEKEAKSKDAKAADGGTGELGRSDSAIRPEIAALAQERFDRVVNAFVSLFAAPPAAPQDVFSSTADQALFFANDSRIQKWLSPAEGSLTHRLQAVADSHQLADELYLAILSRPATSSERQRVGDYLALRKKEQKEAIKELAWGLLSSVEFRFNH